MKKESIITKL